MENPYYSKSPYSYHNWELPKEADVQIKYMEGCKFYILWVNTEVMDNMLYTGLTTSKACEEIIKYHNWNLLES